MKVIEIDDKTYLRFVYPKDAEDLFALIDKNREVLSQWLAWVDKINEISDQKNTIIKFREKTAKLESHDFVIIHDGKPSGMCGFVKISNKDQSGEIGYWLDKDLHGQGLMSKCVGGLIKFGFEFLDLNRIVIRAAVGNHASRKVAEKNGLQLEGVARQSTKLGDKYLDSAIYSILKEEFKN